MKLLDFSFWWSSQNLNTPSEKEITKKEQKEHSSVKHKNKFHYKNIHLTNTSTYAFISAACICSTLLIQNKNDKNIAIQEG